MARLRATAHPVRLRILSLLTAEAMSAAEVARTLEITHANASYHLRLLHDAGALVVESEEKIRGGVAKRYRYDASRDVADPAGPALDDRIAYARAMRGRDRATPPRRGAGHLHLQRPRGLGGRRDAGAARSTCSHEASHLLHAAARPAGTPDTVHVSATHQRLHDVGRADRRCRSLEPGGVAMTWADAIAPLRNRNFAWYFASRLVNTLGNMMASIALAFAVLDITDSPTALGQVLAAHTIPMVALLLYGGVIADRFPRTLVLQFSNLASAVSQGAIAVLVLAGHAEIWMLVVPEHRARCRVGHRLPGDGERAPAAGPRGPTCSRPTPSCHSRATG